EEAAHLLDGEPRVTKQPDHGQAVEGRGVVAATTAHSGRGVDQAGLLVETERGWAKPRPASDLTDREQLIGFHLTSSVLEVPASPLEVETMTEPTYACSLDDGELTARRREWKGLDERARLSTESRPDGHLIVYRGGEETARVLAALIEAERECCPFLEFTVERE